MLRTVVFVATFQIAIALRIYQTKSKTFVDSTEDLTAGTTATSALECDMVPLAASWNKECSEDGRIGDWALTTIDEASIQALAVSCIFNSNCLSTSCYFTTESLEEMKMHCVLCEDEAPSVPYNTTVDCAITAAERYAGSNNVANCCEAYHKICTASSNGDPHVVNMGGQKFDIVALGTFSFVHYPRLTENTPTQLNIDGTVTRFGKGCHSTFVSEVTIQGSWLAQPMIVRSPDSNGASPAELEMRNHTDEPWSVPTPTSNAFSSLTIPDKRSFILKVQGVRVAITAHQYHQKGGSTKNWNFLNLDVSGLAKLPGDVGGLLSLEDHSHVTTGDDKSCDSPKLTAGIGHSGPLSYIRGQ